MGNRILVRARKKAAEKAVRAMMLRRQELRRYRRDDDRERIAFEKPVFWGYQRRLILRQDVARRKDAKRLLELLKIVQKEELSRRKDFKCWNPKARRWEVWNHTPRELDPREFQRLPPDLQCYFESFCHERFGSQYRVRFQWWFETRRCKWYLTHRFLPNVERERELSFLKAKIDQEQLFGLYAKVKSRKARWKTWSRGLSKQKARDQIHRIEVASATELQAMGLLALERGKEVMHDAQT
jgi:hypothetical protein